MELKYFISRFEFFACVAAEMLEGLLEEASIACRTSFFKETMQLETLVLAEEYNVKNSYYFFPDPKKNKT